MAYLGMMLVTDLLCIPIARIYGNNFIILHIYSFAELSIILYLYQKILFRKTHVPLLILGILGLAYIAWEALFYYVFSKIIVKDFQPYAKIADNFVVILLTLAYMQERISRFRESEWGNFRLNMAFLIYFTVNTIFFLPFNFLVNVSNDVKFYFWTGHIAMLLLLYSYLGLKLLSVSYKGKTGLKLH